MLRYLLYHPGAMATGSTRNHYSDGLRHFVLEFRQRYHHVPLAAFAQAVQIPADTLADWLRVPPAAVESESESAPKNKEDGPHKASPRSLMLARTETVLAEWKRWDGTFTAFGRHVRHHLHIPWGLDVLRDILDALGVRTPKRRPGRSPDEKALRRQFETFFPGAQWVGDGSPIPIRLLGHRFVFNFELITDACSGAFTGFNVRDHEDSQAVVSAFNHRPRTDRGGRSRTQIYLEADPTPDEIDEARTALHQRLRKQERALETRRRRADPQVRLTLDQAFEQLGLPDPSGNLRDAIAIYPLDAVLEAVSIFEGKLHAQTPPPGADGRYLLGIARNLAHAHEGLHIAHALWKNRSAARDQAFQHLHTQRQLIVDQTPGHEPLHLVSAFADRALESSCPFDRMFWLETTAETILTQPPPAAEPLFHFAAQRIAATFRVPYGERLQALRFPAARILPLHHLHDVARAPTDPRPRGPGSSHRRTNPHIPSDRPGG